MAEQRLIKRPDEELISDLQDALGDVITAHNRMVQLTETTRIQSAVLPLAMQVRRTLKSAGEQLSGAITLLEVER